MGQLLSPGLAPELPKKISIGAKKRCREIGRLQFLALLMGLNGILWYFNGILMGYMMVTLW
jgi:hypothetical protein